MLYFKNMSLLMSTAGWTVLGALFLTAGDVLFRHYLSSMPRYGFAASFAVYLTGFFFMMLSFFGQNIAVASILAILFNIAFYLGAAHYMFGDTVTARQVAGIVLGLAAVFLLEGAK